MSSTSPRLKRCVLAGLALVYFGLIPLFAWIYEGSGPGSFFDSNLGREASHFADQSSVEARLTQSVRRRLSTKPWVGPIASRSASRPRKRRTLRLVLDRGSVDVVQLVLSANGEVDIEVVGRSSTPPRTEPKVVGNFIEWVKFGPSVLIGGVAEFPVQLSAAPGPPATTAYPFQPPVAMLFPPAVRTASGGSGLSAPFLQADAKTAQQLNNARSQAAGDPAAQSDLLWRMTYFSATTQTTLGLGDITPVSDGARLWVTVQAVLGVFIVGLFLAALGKL